jgi:membrane-bound serine protease (ClpP class)
VVAESEFRALIARMETTPVPIGVWVGPAGSSAEYAAADLLRPADLRGRAPGTRIAPEVAKVVSAPTLGDFVVSLDEVDSRAGVLSTAKVEVNAAGEPRRKPLVDVRFVEPTLMARLLHIVASPAVSYLLLLAGAGLVLLELFSLGGGLAASTAVVCLLLSAYGLAELPTRPLGLGLLLVSIVSFGVDIQAGTARFWSGLGTLALLGGTLTLFGRGLEGPVGLPWPAALFGILGLLLLVIRAMPSIVRSRTTAGGLNPSALAALEAEE